DPHPEDDDDISTAPFTSQPAFGKGLWRHPINFIPASSSTSAPTPPSSTPLSIADAYLAIVCPSSAANPEPDHPTCPTCAHPIKEADSRAHYLSLVHQLSLPRTPTPSAIDRSRMGLKYMEKHGFDVDARKGLGTTGEGRLYPIVPKEKRDLHGIGVQVQGPEEGGEKGRGVAKARVVERLDAGKIQKRARAEKKRDERLRRMFYEDEKVGKYLGDL
ncbi:hypothetical protein K491DRAFT_575759, partial [Lophiostoma macrostomum CBS 122681]